ncbi:MAG TPA: flagellar hook-length control protein FliK [Candidatus Wallbacteria bacterium]|nr:flagellar hook-length control protein FliK [Candidatus Wallbacteria bacterium]
MLLTKAATASPPKTEQARPEPFMAETAAKYERSFLEVLTRQIDLGKNQTYMATESSELISNKLSSFPLNQFKYEAAAGSANIKAGALLFETGSQLNFKPVNIDVSGGSGEAAGTNDKNEIEAAETHEPESKKVESGAERTDEVQNGDKIDEKNADPEKSKDEKTAEDMQKYLQEIFASRLNVKVGVKRMDAGQDGKFEISINGIKDEKGVLKSREFLAKIEGILKKQFPGVKLADFKIEMVKIDVNAAALKHQSPDSTAQPSTAAVASKLAGVKTGDKTSPSNSDAHGNAGGKDKNHGGDGLQMFGFSGENLAKNNAEIKETQLRATQKFDQVKMLEQIRSHLNETKFTSANGTYSIKMILRPEELGKINLEMVMKDGQLSAKFNAENSATAELLNASIDQLKEMLNEKGIKVVNVELGNYGRGFESGSGGNFTGGGENRPFENFGENGPPGGATIRGAEGEVEFAEIIGDKNKSVFILSDKKVNVRV